MEAREVAREEYIERVCGATSSMMSTLMEEEGSIALLRTGCRSSPLWLDLLGPIRGEGRHDLALRLWLVQKLVVIHIALRDAL